MGHKTKAKINDHHQGQGQNNDESKTKAHQELTTIAIKYDYARNVCHLADYTAVRLISEIKVVNR